METGKRLFDLTIAALGLALLAPLLLFVAIALKLTSQGPVLFRQARVGLHGGVFHILKFRTMTMTSERLSSGVTLSGDPRLTRVGSILRPYKIDELPQLWNVLTGDMSLVGPRPELPCYVGYYSALQREVLSTKPGITDPASLAFCHEDELLATQSDPERFYLEKVLPDKLNRSLGYLDRVSFVGDLKLIIETFVALTSPAHKHRRILPAFLRPELNVRGLAGHSKNRTI